MAELAIERAPVRVTYRNHRGEVRLRRVLPRRIWFGAVEWHPGPQWLLEVHDIEKGEPRTFAMNDILHWGPTEVPTDGDGA